MIVLGEFEMHRRHLRQTIQTGARVFAAGDVERIEQVQTAQVVLEQRGGAAVFAWALGEYLRVLVGAEQQRHPSVAGHVLIQQPDKLSPEIGGQVS
ncbi:hypothetical protein BVK86_12205 [Pseudomonas reinekei]|uniref:Uncharacterized protein n=1 Tax=Pseudomonas reinekei TaxID=395598 RepID=A0A1Q9WWD9_PSERE|nr:hypothetical protein BVK86_12205 [Pseudomonas reinekei]